MVKDALEFCESVPVVSEETRSREKTVHQLPQIENAEYVPSFNQHQRNQLDEQLRNVSTFKSSFKFFLHTCTPLLSEVHVCKKSIDTPLKKKNLLN